ncbi:MAG: EF-hand domain-containing protein [Pseudomonadales bacterium]
MTQNTNRTRAARRLRQAMLVGGALAVSMAALAGSHHGGPEFPISIADARAKAEARFEAVDQDGDGAISRAEFDAAPPPDGRGHHPWHRGGWKHGPGHHRHQDGMAADADPASREQRRAEWQARREAAEAELFAALDTDGDGKLSAAEFDTGRMKEARRDARRERAFARLDRNGDGMLSRDELPDPVARLEAMDADGDGLVSQAEAEAARQARQGKAE